jgi:hypothetical protein
MKWFRRKIGTQPKFDPPGPSPWYLRGRTIESEAGYLTWADYGNDPVLAGVSRLTGSHGKDVLLLDFYCYVRPLHNGRILLWYENTRNLENMLINSFVHFDIIDICSAEPISDSRAEAERMRKEKSYRVFHTKPLVQFTYFTTVEPGKHVLRDVPPALAEAGEILVLADYCPGGKPSNQYDCMCRAIFAFAFADNQVEVIPQDWFNNGAYDFGYQWITRVGRDSKTQQIFGEGIRLGFFRLDTTGWTVEEWLVTDPFYRPRG